MKKYVLLLLLISMLFSLTGCSWSKVEREGETKEDQASMFVVVENALSWDVVYHRETGVMYAVSHGYYNSGTFTLMVDRDGKPLIWKGQVKK